jgi:LPXTG-motif cell wall-anchored protein
MNTLNTIWQSVILGAVGGLLIAAAPRLAAQDTSTTSVQHGAPSIETTVRNAEVVYVEGNDLVLKLDSGRVEHVVVPDSDVFTIDGRNVSVRELKAGTKLTQTFTVTSTPRYVNTIRTIKGKVWHVNTPSSVIVTLPDHTNQVFRVPGDARFTVNGKPKSVFDLKKGMTFEATIVTDEPQTVVAHNKTVVGTVPPAPPAPPLVGVLLFQPSRMVVRPEPTGTVNAEHVESWARLPQTASPLPWIGVAGLSFLTFALAFGLVRRKTTNL